MRRSRPVPGNADRPSATHFRAPPEQGRGGGVIQGRIESMATDGLKPKPAAASRPKNQDHDGNKPTGIES